MILYRKIHQTYFCVIVFDVGANSTRKPVGAKPLFTTKSIELIPSLNPEFISNGNNPPLNAS